MKLEAESPIVNKYNGTVEYSEFFFKKNGTVYLVQVWPTAYKEIPIIELSKGDGK